MEIRMLGLQELSLALDLVWEVFEQDVAPSYREEGIEKFREYICYEDMSRRFQTRELYFFGAFEGEKLLGVIAVSRTGHICLFFVRKDQQGKGIGKMLYQKARTLHTGACSEPCDYECNSQCGKFLYASGNACC